MQKQGLTLGKKSLSAIASQGFSEEKSFVLLKPNCALMLSKKVQNCLNA